MITYNNKDILKSFIGNKRVVRKYLNNKIVYGIPDFAQYYNIQGYDNYEVVGNPTIVDGVVSGFSSGSYITTEGDTDFNQHFEISISCIKGPNRNQSIFSRRTRNNGVDVTFPYNNRCTIRLWLNNSVIYNVNEDMGGFTLEENTKYIMKFTYDGDDRYYFAILNNITKDILYSRTIIESTKLNNCGVTFGGVFGGSALYNPWEGSIDFNETYIKVNGEYWFNGNPNYKELLDCNPNVYLKNINTSYVDTNYIPSKYTRIKFNFKIDNVREISPNTRNWIMGASAKYRVMNNFYVGFWQRSDTSAAFWPNSTNLDVAQYITYVWELNKKYFVDFKGSSAVADDAYTDLYDENGNRKFHVLNSNTDDIDMLGKTLLLFIRKDNVNSPNAYFLGSLYAIQIYERDVLKMNLIPVPQGLQIGSYKVPSNGMFDIVEQKFYANSGRGEFIWGVDL